MLQQFAFWANIKQQISRLSSWQYFEPTIAIITVFVFFILGRKTYESKFSYVLGIINDAQNEKRRLHASLQKYNTSLRNIRSKLTFMRIITIVVVLIIGICHYYKIRKLGLDQMIYIALAIVIIWTIIILRIQYLEMIIKRTDAKLQRKTLSSESDSKQLMALLGQELCSALKTKFERDLHLQTQQEQLRQCDLKRCYDEKKVLKELYEINKVIISEMQQMSWCDTCAQNLNIQANELKIGELQGRLKNYKSIAGGLPLEKKKQLTNRLLGEWESLEGKLPRICRRGCCIRFRVSVQQIKKKHHDKLMQIKNALNSIK